MEHQKHPCLSLSVLEVDLVEGQSFTGTILAKYLGANEQRS